MNEKLLQEYEKEAIEKLIDTTFSLSSLLNKEQTKELSDAITDLTIARRAVNLFYKKEIETLTKKNKSLLLKK